MEKTVTTEHEISDETLAKLGELPTQTLIDGLWVDDWPQAMIHGARPIFPGPEDGRQGSDASICPSAPRYLER